MRDKHFSNKSIDLASSSWRGDLEVALRRLWNKTDPIVSISHMKKEIEELCTFANSPKNQDD